MKLPNLFDAIRSLCEAIKEVNSWSTPPLPQPPDVSEKEKLSFSEKYESWWALENAKAIRKECSPFAPYVFKCMSDFEKAFGNTLDKFYFSHGQCRIIKSFSEIHITFIAVDVYHLRDMYNRRDIALDKLFKNELTIAYVSFAASKGIQLDGIFNALITNLWLVNTTLYMELPISVFPINHPTCASVLAPDEYWIVKKNLDKTSEI